LNSKYWLIISLSLLLLGPIPLRKALSDDKLSTVIRGIRGRYGNAKGLTAEYTREAISKTMAMLEVAERHDLAKGRIYFSPPHFLRLEQASPQEELLSNILQGLKDTEDSFRITLKAMPETNTYHLILVPEPPWQEIDHLEVIVLKADFAIKQVDLYNTIGGLTRFLFTDWEEKDRFSPGFFSFSPPPGIKVIEE
jgi:outer membrane lipoprotein-sorting protein